MKCFIPSSLFITFLKQIVSPFYGAWIIVTFEQLSCYWGDLLSRIDR